MSKVGGAFRLDNNKSASGGRVSVKCYLGRSIAYFWCMETITWDDFEKIDMRIGTIISAVSATGLKRPAYRMEIDFGALGTRRNQLDKPVIWNTDLLGAKDLSLESLLSIV